MWNLFKVENPIQRKHERYKVHKTTRIVTHWSPMIGAQFLKMVNLRQKYPCLELDEDQVPETNISTVRDGECGFPYEHAGGVALQFQGLLNLFFGEAEFGLFDVTELIVLEQLDEPRRKVLRVSSVPSQRV